MPVTLESRSRRMQVFHLPHEVCCRDRCTCTDVVAFVAAEHSRTGERARKRVVKRVPGSITFLARERKENVPAALLELAQVRVAIGRGYLRVVAQTPDLSAPPAAAAVATPGQVTSPAPGQPTAGAASAHVPPPPESAELPMASALATSGPAPAPVPPSTSSAPPAPSSVPSGSSAHAAAPAPATQPPGKEA